MSIVYVVAAVLLIWLIYFGIRYRVKASKKFGGGQLVVCPETNKEAIISIDVGHAALTSLLGQTDIRLENCWRWPNRENCGQECLSQLQVAPDNCLVRSVLMKWYKDKRCAFCRRVFDEPQIIDHKPALLSPGGVLLEWHEIALPNVAEVMTTHRPVCWNCYITQAFRRDHPELVVDRSLSEAEKNVRALR
jgi:hypothetical protein